MTKEFVSSIPKIGFLLGTLFRGANEVKEMLMYLWSNWRVEVFKNELYIQYRDYLTEDFCF